MNLNIETLNEWGGRFLDFAWPMLWQSSLLIVLVFSLDLLLTRKIRAAVRYALWLTVLVKLLLPPTLALPSSVVWWLLQAKTTAIEVPQAKVTVTYGAPAPSSEPEFVFHDLPPMPKPRLDDAGYVLLASVAVSAGLLLLLLLRWRQMNGNVRRAAENGHFADTFEAARQISGLRSRIKLKMVDDHTSPAVYGLFAPVILLPRILAEKLSSQQLRTVLLHELIHLRRADVWVNCAQTFLQIVYWWHPLLWFANARIRRVREEAVDDAVMLALCDEIDLYAPTLLEVAKLAFQRPRLSLGLVGIMESRSALRQRIERLVRYRAPRKAGLTWVSILGILMFFAVAAPMGGAPAEQADSLSSIPRDQDNIVESFVLDHPIGTNTLYPMLVDAGVKMPPTQIFYDSNGILVGDGSPQQLNIICATVMKLDGQTPDQIKRFLFSKSNPPPVLPPGLATNLQSRVYEFKYPAELLNIAGDKSGDVSVAARSLFARLGVDWESPKGKSIAYSKQKGLLFVRANGQDCDTIERVSLGLGALGPQIHIKARFIKVPRDSLDWVTNQIGGTTGILSDGNMRRILRALEAHPGVETLVEPEVVTISGRQTQMRATTINYVLTNYTYAETSSNLSVIPQTGAIQFGPMFDVIPSVSADTQSIYLHATALVTGFVGYDQPTNPTVLIHTKLGKKFNLPNVMPCWYVQKESADITVLDNQTVILGLSGLKKQFYDGGKEVGSEPSFFKQDDKEILFLVTVTLVDDAGNRIHSN